MPVCSRRRSGSRPLAPSMRTSSMRQPGRSFCADQYITISPTAKLISRALPPQPDKHSPRSAQPSDHPRMAIRTARAGADGRAASGQSRAGRLSSRRRRWSRPAFRRKKPSSPNSVDGSTSSKIGQARGVPPGSHPLMAIGAMANRSWMLRMLLCRTHGTSYSR